jgi:hypothetical protein
MRGLALGGAQAAAALLVLEFGGAHRRGDLLGGGEERCERRKLGCGRRLPPDD